MCVADGADWTCRVQLSVSCPTNDRQKWANNSDTSEESVLGSQQGPSWRKTMQNVQRCLKIRNKTNFKKADCVLLSNCVYSSLN